MANLSRLNSKLSEHFNNVSDVKDYYFVSSPTRSYDGFERCIGKFGLKVPYYGGHRIDLPICGYNQIMDIINMNNLITSDRSFTPSQIRQKQFYNSMFIVPLIISRKPFVEVKTIQKALNIYSNYRNNSLSRIKCNDDVYYTGNGILLNSDFIPLMLLSYITEFVQYNTNNVKRTVRTKAIITISDAVFDSSKTIEKGLKKIVANAGSIRLYIYEIGNHLSTTANFSYDEIEVRVANLDNRIIHTPKIDEIPDNEVCKELLANNCDSVLNTLFTENKDLL